jgi:hypothetical protein
VNKKIVSCICIYVVMAFMTNSYVRNYRYKDWANYENGTDLNAENRRSASAGLSVLFSTAFWPLYVGSRLTDSVVDVMMTTKVEVERPEILR